MHSLSHNLNNHSLRIEPPVWISQPWKNKSAEKENGYNMEGWEKENIPGRWRQVRCRVSQLSGPLSYSPCCREGRNTWRCNRLIWFTWTDQSSFCSGEMENGKGCFPSIYKSFTKDICHYANAFGILRVFHILQLLNCNICENQESLTHSEGQ